MIRRPAVLPPPELKSAVVQAPLTASPETKVIDAIAQMSCESQLLDSTRIGDQPSGNSLHQLARASCILVIDDGHVVGILTEQDVVRLSLQPQSLEQLVMQQVMTQPVVTLRESTLTSPCFIANLLQQHRIRHLPIVDAQDYLVGLVTCESLQSALCSLQPSNLQMQQVEASLHLTQTQLAVKNTLLAKIANDDPLAEMLTLLVKSVEHSLDGAICSILLLDQDNRLHYEAAPGLPAAYKQAMNGIAIGADVESCGTAAFHKQSIIVDDIAENHLWQNYKYLALEHGLRACWSIPIMTGDSQVLGVFEVYYREVRSPRPQELQNVAQMVHIAGVAIKHHQAEAALRESDARWQFALEGTGDGVWDWSREADTVFFSHQWKAMLGYADHEIGNHADEWQNRIHPDDQEHCQAELDRHFQGQTTTYQIEHRLRCKDGSYKWVLSRGKTIEWTNTGQPKRVIGTHEDISDRKQAEAALKESEERFRTLFETTPRIAVQGYDRDRRVIYWNDASEQFYGYTKAEAIGQLRDDLILPADMRQAIASDCHQWFQAGIPIPPGELNLNRKDNSRIPVYSSPVMLTNTRGELELYCIDIDLTEYKQTETQLQNLIAGTAATTGQDFFPALVSHLAEALGVSHAMVTEKVDHTLTTLAYYADGALRPNFTYAIHNTPCEIALEEGSFYVGKSARQQFSGNQLLAAIESESYVSVALQNSQGEAIGNLCILHRQPIQNPEWAKQILQVFAARAGAELERQRTNLSLERLNQSLEAKIVEATATLREREQFLQTVLDTFPLSVFWKDRDSVYQGCNRRFAQSTGLAPAEIVGKTDYELRPAAEADGYRAYDRRVMTSAKAELGIIGRHTRGDGSQAWVETNKLPLYDLAGEVDGILGTFQDITDRKHAEEGLRRYERIVSATTDGLVVIDRNYVYRAVNKAYLKRNNKTYDEVVGHSVRDIRGERDFLARLKPRLDRCLAGELVRQECWFDFPNLSQRYVVIDYAPYYDVDETISGVLATTRDITEQKLLELSLKQTTQQLQTFLENAPTLISIFDAEGQYHQANPAFAKLLGIPETSIKGSNFADFFPQPAVEAFRARVQRLIKTQQPLETEDEITIWGETRVFQSILFPVNGKEEGTQVFGAIATDITERKRSEKSARLLASVVESTNDAVITKTLDGIITSWNQGAVKLFGYAEAAALDQSILMLFPSDRLQERAPFIQQIREGKRVEPFETVRLRQDGTPIEVSVTMSPLTEDRTGQVWGSAMIVRDITERKQVEAERSRAQAVRKELDLLERILNNVLAGYWDWDIPNHQEYLSPGFRQMFGYEDHELPNTPNSWQNLVLSEDLHLIQASFDRHVQSRGEIPYYNELRYRHKNGSTKWVICSGQVIEWDVTGSPQRMIGCHIDITERKQTEAQLRQTNQKLARVTRLKDEFLASMSHELRTPLNAILGMTEGLQGKTFGPVNRSQVDALQTIERSASHLLELINDVLDVAKIESGQIELNLTPTSVATLCRSTLAFIRQQALKKSIQLTMKLPNGRVPDLQLDERRIRQVLINLLNNAVKFTPSNGRITLEVNYQSCPASPETSTTAMQGCLQIEVIDTGIGIAPANIDKLFQPFVQIDTALNRQYKGTGLGLSLVKRIVELHGGQVDVVSKLGKGSRFTVNLPHLDTVHTSQHPNAMVPVNDEQRSPQALDSPLILLAEDNEANIKTISSYLKAKGYRTVLAQNGAEAIAIAQTEHPDLVLMDIQMPGIDGLEAIRQIRRESTLMNIPVIALTALAMPSDRQRCLTAGANDYLSKPIKLKQLATIIQQLLASDEGQGLLVQRQD